MARRFLYSVGPSAIDVSSICPPHQFFYRRIQPESNLNPLTPWRGIAFIEECFVQQMTNLIRWSLLMLVVIALASCGGAREPSEPVADPRAYAIEALQTIDLNTWWQAYRNPDPALLGRIVDEVVAKQPDGLPTDARKLDTFIRQRIAPSYRLYMDDTDEGKAYLLAQAAARFANPPMALWDKNEFFALVDYHILPGEWRPTTRVSEGLTHPPAVGAYPFLKPDVLAATLQRLVAAYPDARNYQIRYQYHHGSDSKKILMEFSPDHQIVYRENGSISFTAEAVPWDDLLHGRIDLADLNWDGPMEGYEGPSMTYPPDDPLPSGQ